MDVIVMHANSEKMPLKIRACHLEQMRRHADHVYYFKNEEELLASGAAKNVSAAAKMVDLSRSAFYKYKDSVFDFENTKSIVTVKAVLLDETGALQALLRELSASGASIVTINQSAPENGTAVVSVTLRTDSMPQPIDDVLLSIQGQRTVVSIRRTVKEL